MERITSLFSLFGGIRPMARKIKEPASNVAAWKRVGRIPAEKQPHVLEVGLSLGLPITAEHVVFPLGRPDRTDILSLHSSAPPVACDRRSKAQ